MQKKLKNPFASATPLSGPDQAVLEVFTSLMRINGMPTPAAPPARPVPRPAQLQAPVPDQPRKWGRLTPDNWNSREACRRDNVRIFFDLLPSTSPLPEFAGKTPALEKFLDYPCSAILNVDECCKYYGYDPQSSEVCSREVLRLRMERCVELRLRYPDDLSATDMHEHHVLHGDCGLHLRFLREFPAEHRELTIKLLCHERKWTRKQAEQHLAECEKSRARAEAGANALAKARREARHS
jgi:hypothetical protein